MTPQEHGIAPPPEPTPPEQAPTEATASASSPAGPAARRTRSTKGLARAMRVDDADLAVRRRAACVLEVLAGVRTPEDAAAALGLQLASFYQLEERALRGLVGGCDEQPRGRAPDLAKALEESRRRIGDLEREVQRHQALLRGAQRAAGLLGDARAGPAARAPSPSRPPPLRASAGAGGSGGRRTIRALRAVEALRAPPAHGAPAPASGNPAATGPAGGERAR